jgi:hypothetical protein
MVAEVSTTQLASEGCLWVDGRTYLNDDFMLVQGIWGISSILLKLKITKAFDMMDSELLEVLAKLGFSERLLWWICGLLTMA